MFAQSFVDPHIRFQTFESVFSCCFSFKAGFKGGGSKPDFRKRNAPVVHGLKNRAKVRDKNILKHSINVFSYFFRVPGWNFQRPQDRRILLSEYRVSRNSLRTLAVTFCLENVVKINRKYKVLP